MIGALRNRDFRLLLSGQVLSLVGDWLLVVAVPFFLYRSTGSAAAAGLLYAAQNLPTVLLGPVAGVLVDRWDRRTTMLAADVARCGLLGAAAVAPERHQLAAVVAAVVGEAIIGQLYSPASAALVPNLVGTDGELTAANAMSSAAGAIVRLVAGPAGGVLFVAVGLRWLLAADATTFALSALTVLLLRRRRVPGNPRSQRRDLRRSIAGELLEGVGHLRRTPVVRRATSVVAVMMIGNGAAAGLLVVYVADHLHRGAAGLGIVLSALGAGYLIGAPLTVVLEQRLEQTRLVAAATTVIGASFLVLFDTGSLAVACAAAVVAGAGGAVTLVTAATITQRHTPDDLRGRVAAATAAIIQAAQVTGTLAGAFTALAIGIRTTLQGAAAVIVLGGLIGLRRRPLDGTDDSSEDPASIEAPA